MKEAKTGVQTQVMCDDEKPMRMRDRGSRSVWQAMLRAAKVGFPVRSCGNRFRPCLMRQVFGNVFNKGFSHLRSTNV